MCCHAVKLVIFNVNQIKWKDIEMKTIFCPHEKVKCLQFGTSSKQSQRSVDQSAGAVDWTWKGAVWGLSWYWFGALGFDESMISDAWNGKKRLKENVSVEEEEILW